MTRTLSAYLSQFNRVLFSPLELLTDKLRTTLGRTTLTRHGGRTVPFLHSYQPRLELLEDRLTPATHPLTSVPVLNSLPGASATLYLDFDGDFQSQWSASYSNITTPAFDQDGDATTFSDTELAAINQIWQYVAEDYAPFNLNVTTVAPASFGNGEAIRVVIGGDGSWYSGGAGGVAVGGSFTNSAANVAFVFSKVLNNGYVKYVAEAASHEAGHTFGLQHQSLYDANGTKIQGYYTGPGDGRAPIMGGSNSASRGLWWYGTSSSATTIQDDMAVIASATNGFGYRADDHGGTSATATPLSVSGDHLNGSGIIATTSDRDYFSFSTGAGQISLMVSVPTLVQNLDARLELRDEFGNLIASADPSTSFGATITATVAAGSYRLVVASHGSYGDVGQYTVSGTVAPDSAPSSTTPTAPSNLNATVAATIVNLTWSDNASNETGYELQRSLDGANWNALANLTANAVAFSDTSVTAGKAYYYRVYTVAGTESSSPSNVASAVTAPVAPGGLTATGVSSSQINLAWTDVAGESGYKIQRSSDGVNWTQIATTATNVTTYQNTGLSGGTIYWYRVQAWNAGGSSAFGTPASAATLAGQPPPAAPTNLVAATVSSKKTGLSWTDNASNESGFLIERSVNGGAWTQIAQVGANATSFTDSTAARKTYAYRVRAFNSSGNSAYTNIAQPGVANLSLTLPTTEADNGGTPTANEGDRLPLGCGCLLCQGAAASFTRPASPAQAPFVQRIDHAPDAANPTLPDAATLHLTPELVDWILAKQQDGAFDLLD